MENTLSKEDLDKLQDLERNTTNVKMQLAEVTVSISELDSRKSHLVQIHNDLEKQSIDFSTEIRSKYGNVKSINYKTGELELETDQ
jgi:predicted phage-related endonuclease